MGGTRNTVTTVCSTVGGAEFEAVIRPDTALTTSLLRLANSAYFGRSRKIDSVRQAITLLGVKRLFKVAAGAAFTAIIPSRIPGYEIEAQAFWKHNVAVAILSERLAIDLGAADQIMGLGKIPSHILEAVQQRAA